MGFKKSAKRLVATFAVSLLLLSNVFAYSIPTAHAEGTGYADDLFISEYIEGSSYNKAIELFNGTGNDVTLDQYSLELYSNGSSNASQTLQLSGTLASGDVYVLAHTSANEAIKAVSDQLNGSVINFNGDDAVVLKHNGAIIDVIGQIGVDPGSSWGSGETSTANHTLVRKSSVSAGDANPGDTFDPALEWTGYSQDSSDNLGSHTGGGDSPEDPGTPAEGTIADARTKTGQTVTVTGVVTADNAAIGGGRIATYIQDKTGGISLFAFEAAGFPELKEGQKIKVTGTVQSYHGLLEIVPTAEDVDVLSENNPLPEPVSLSLADLNQDGTAESQEGQLVKVSGYVQSVPGTPAGGGYNVRIIDSDFNGITVRIMEDTQAIDDLEPGKWYEFTGILSQYDTYQVLPRKAGDIHLSAEQPDPPSQAGEYESTVASVVDGDTIHLQTPVLGADTVRYVNIDTPETYHTPVTEADESQKRHGEAAKAYLNELLKPGDPVIVKVGKKTTDDYGRLLAQVIRKNDHLNTNLEMVKKGYAVTYFIWPTGDETDYNTFQTAVREAKDAGLGIWDPDDPLAELPFVFRARDQGKGLLRYVGNSDTKKYVVPAEWEKVPVDKRIFFASSEEAESNGYVSADTGNENAVKVQLLGVNDLHGKVDVTGTTSDGEKVGRMDYLAAYLHAREAENPNTLTVDAGDMIGASSPVSALLQDEPTVEMMESMGFDVGTVGNHEFDEGLDEMLRMIHGGTHPEGKGTPNYDGMNFPVVAANVTYKDTGKLVLPPYAIKEVGGQKIGFIGVTTINTPSMIISSGNENLRFTDEAAAINKYVPELKKQGVESIVVLAHVPGTQSGSGAEGDIASIANQIDDEVDVIFAAHNHVKLNAVVDGKLIVQAWEYGKAFSDVDLEIDPSTHDIVKKSAEIVDVVQDGVTPDPEVHAILDKYLAMVGPKLNEVIGTAASPITGGYAQKGEIGDNGLGNLIADGMKAAMHSDFALMNGGGIRDNLDAGDITWNELFNVQPFGNALVKVELTGAELREVLNTQFSSYGPDFSVSGFRYTWAASRGQYGEVVDIFLPDGSRVNPLQSYTVTVNNYMYPHSTDKYHLHKLGKNPVQGPDDLQATVDYVQSFDGPITYGAEGRISQITPVPIEGVTLDQMAATLKVGDTVDLNATIDPQDTTDDRTLTWKSSYDQIATVNSEGKVTGVKEGKATITVMTSNGKTATAAITVEKKEVPIESVTLSQTAAELKRGESLQLTAVIMPENTTDRKDLTWTSSNAKVATVDQTGKVTARKKGAATITVTTINGKTAKARITVSKFKDNGNGHNGWTFFKQLEKLLSRIWDWITFRL